ncbi:hypothetical protein ACNZ61_002122 [Enterococcus hirae]
MYEDIPVPFRARLGIKDLDMVALFGNCFELEEIKPAYRYKKKTSGWGAERMYPTKEIVGYSCLVTVIDGEYSGYLLQIKVPEPIVPELPERTAEQPVIYGTFEGLSCSYVKGEKRFMLYLQAERMEMSFSLPTNRLLPR